MRHSFRAAFGVSTSPNPVVCLADRNNDRAVTVDDMQLFMTAFESGNVSADIDNGTSTGVRDQAVDVGDLLYFLLHFELGR
jgi:hypothetical protein